MSKLKPYTEQYNYRLENAKPERKNNLNKEAFPLHEEKFESGSDKVCYKVLHDDSDEAYVETSYFIGYDWLGKSNKVIHVIPKLDSETRQVDYFQMVLHALSGRLSPRESEGLFRIDFDKPKITIQQQDDYLAPLLYAQFLQIIRELVHAGLRKDYYTRQENLTARVRGKVLVNATIKANVTRGRLDRTFCAYQEYGLDHFENRLLKKALQFVGVAINSQDAFKGLRQNYNYCMPAFVQVGAELDTRKVLAHKPNPFYKKYGQALKLAQLILKRSGFELESAASNTVRTPPFWVNMSKVFELYVYQHLKQVPDLQVWYEPIISGLRPDFIVKSKEFMGVIDAKYKPRYKNRSLEPSDILQVAGYARMKGVYKYFVDPVPESPELLDAMIVYSDQEETQNFKWESKDLDNRYVQFSKLGFKIPERE